MEKVIIVDNEQYNAIVVRYPATKDLPERYEVKIEKGISINDHDQYGDNLLYEWIFPSSSYDNAVTEFIRRVKAERQGIPWK